jgi:hypothetical protein
MIYFHVALAVGGVMAFLTLHEMLPLAFDYAGQKQAIKAVFIGMAVMSTRYFLAIVHFLVFSTTGSFVFEKHILLVCFTYRHLHAFLSKEAFLRCDLSLWQFIFLGDQLTQGDEFIMFYIILGSLNFYFMLILDTIAILSMARSKSCYRKATILQFQFYFSRRISLPLCSCSFIQCK